MLLLILGYFLLPSLTEGTNKVFTCSPGRLTATCDAGKVILIGRVFRGSYTGTFNGSHCKHQGGDSLEKDDGNSKDVWENCNLQNECTVKFIVSGNYYLEMDFECVYKSNIDMLDICDTGNGTRLVSEHGYIHSPCYPNVSTWTEPTHVYCQCSGTFQFPVRAEHLAIRLFHTFQETETLEIRWGVINNQPETFRNTTKSFEMKQHKTGSFYLTFYSSYRGSDWDRGFWLEFKANSSLEFKCSNAYVTPPNCQAAIRPTSTTPPATTTATTTPTSTKPTTTSITASTTSSSGGGLPGVKTTIPGTATTSNASTTNATITVDGALPDQDRTTAIAVGIIIPLLVIAVIVATVLIILRKRRQAAKAKSESNEELAHNGSAMVDKASFVNPSFDPESGEQIAEPEEETDTVEDDPLSLCSLANEVVVQLEVGTSKDRAEKDVLILSNNPYSAYDIVPIKPRPSVKPKPAPRKGSQKDASPSDSEKGGNLVGAVSAEVATGPASSNTKLAEEDTAFEKQVSKTGRPKPMPKPKPAAKPKLGSESTTRQAEVEGDTPTDVYAEVEKKGRGLGKVGLGMQAPAGEDSEEELVYATCGAGAGEREAEVEDEPGNDLYTEVNKSVKRKDRSEEGVSENQNGDVYAQVDKTAKPPKPQKPKVPRRNIGGVEDASKRVDDASSGDVYAQVQKGKKTAPPRGEASKCEHVNLDTNRTQDPGGKYSGFTDLYSSVDDVVTETLDDKGEEYSDGEHYGPIDNNGELYGLVDNNGELYGLVDGGDGGELYGSMDDDDDGELYGQVHDAGGYDIASADMAEGRGYDGANPDYGEVVGDIQNGGLTDSDDDTYDHAITIANKFTGRQFGGGPPAPFEPHDDTYDHVVLESAENPNIQSDTEV